jgi:hypothetical protein
MGFRIVSSLLLLVRRGRLVGGAVEVVAMVAMMGG